MSLQTWKDEFYSVEASKAKRWSKVRAIEHSLTKWIGLRPKALKRHEMVKSVLYRWVGDACGAALWVDVDSCALCIKYLHAGRVNCAHCPLYAALGNKPCDIDKESPYFVWVDTGDPEPMIRGLRKALRAAKKEAGS